jgi:hypothetical protein
MSSAKQGVSVQILASKGKSSPAARGKLDLQMAVCYEFRTCTENPQREGSTACNAWNETYALSYVPDKGRRVFGFCNGAPR